MDDLTPRFATRRWSSSPACSVAATRARSPATPPIARCRDASDTGAERGRQRDRGAPGRRQSAPGWCSTRSHTPARCRELVDVYRAAGGTGPCVLVRRAWIGEPPTQLTTQQVDTYRSYAPAGAAANWGADELIAAHDAAEVAVRLADAARAAGVDALNLRVHVPGVTPADARAQIERLGDDVVPAVRDALYRGPASD